MKKTLHVSALELRQALRTKNAMYHDGRKRSDRTANMTTARPPFN